MRILIYSHDTYGLGHLRRSLLITEGLVAHSSRPSVLIATGSPRAQSFSLPFGCDTVKLPSVLKSDDRGYRTRTLRMSLDELIDVRSALLLGALRAFRPDVLLVDHSPVGMGGELHPVFDEMRDWAERPRCILGLRDVVDDAASVAEDWTKHDVWRRLDDDYDGILVYGDESVLTTAEELRLPKRYANKLAFTGYLGRSRVRRFARNVDDTPTVLVTVGGGGDGHHALRAFADALDDPTGPHYRAIIATGPFLSRRRLRELEQRVAPHSDRVDVTSFSEGLSHQLASADAVISMAGYNSVMEVLTARVPTLLFPRERPRREQRIRAERLGVLCNLDVAPGPECTGERINAFVRRALRGELAVRVPVAMDGVHRVVEEVTAVTRPAVRHAQ